MDRKVFNREEFAKVFFLKNDFSSHSERMREKKKLSESKKIQEKKLHWATEKKFSRIIFKGGIDWTLIF